MGDVDSDGGVSSLYVEKLEKDTDYINPVSAGQEVVGVFDKYVFIAQSGSSTAVSGLSGDAEVPWAVQIRICVDVDDATKESDEFNNCYSKLLGNLYGEPEALIEKERVLTINFFLFSRYPVEPVEPL